MTAADLEPAVLLVSKTSASARGIPLLVCTRTSIVPLVAGLDEDCPELDPVSTTNRMAGDAHKRLMRLLI